MCSIVLVSFSLSVLRTTLKLCVITQIRSDFDVKWRVFTLSQLNAAGGRMCHSLLCGAPVTLAIWSIYSRGLGCSRLPTQVPDRQRSPGCGTEWQQKPAAAGWLALCLKLFCNGAVRCSNSSWPHKDEWVEQLGWFRCGGGFTPKLVALVYSMRH